MRYLNENEIQPYINIGKIIEQYLGTFQSEDFLCHRYISIEKNKEGYYFIISEVFDEKEDGIESIYEFSSIDPDNLEGIEYGPFSSFTKLLSVINKKVTLSKDKYLLTGYLDNVISKEYGK